MQNDELVTLYADLQQVLRNAGLGWVVEQVAEQVRLGIPEKKEVPVYSEDTSSAVLLSSTSEQPVVKKGRKTTFDSVREVTPRERVEWLLDAAEEAVLRVAQLEMQSVGEGGSLHRLGIRAVSFVVEEGGTAYARDSAQSGSRLRAAENVKGLLDEIRSSL